MTNKLDISTMNLRNGNVNLLSKEGQRVSDDEWKTMMRAMNHAATVTLLLHTIRGTILGSR